MTESVNTDPMLSPRKSNKDTLTKIARMQNKSEFGSTREHNPAPSVRAIELVPKTPVDTLHDLLSPSSNASTAPHLSRDTPPPGELSTGSDATGRGSRRQRTSVSYAEPSLRDKMRRPTKELVDAVQADGKVKSLGRSDSTDDVALIGNESTTATKPAVRIKLEDDVASWKERDQGRARSDLISPLSGRSTSLSMQEPPLPTSVMTERKKRTSTAFRDSVNADTDLPGSNRVISALVSGSGVGRKLKPKTEPLDDSIFHRETSRPRLASHDDTEKLERMARRFSSIPHSNESSTLSAEGRTRHGASISGTGAAAALATGSNRAKRPTMNLGLAVEGDDVSSEVEEAKAHGGRAERAGRRRSMML